LPESDRVSFHTGRMREKPFLFIVSRNVNKSLRLLPDRKGTTVSTGTCPVNDRPSVDVSLLVVRVVAGVIFAVHGAQKLFGMFGGKGLTALVEGADGQPGMGPIGYLVAVGECFGGLWLIFGFLSRFSAASNIVIMIGAIAMVHGKNGFLLSSGGFEYNLALIGLLLPTILAGPGKYTIACCLPLPRSSVTDRPLVFLE
jgi:putative oxidoreductase